MEDKTLKKIVLKIAAVGICLGLALALIRQVFLINQAAFMRVYWIAAPVIVAGAALASASYYVSYQKKMRRITALLDEGKAEEYIAGMEKMLETAKGQNLRNILKLNLTAGYIDEKQYDVAGHILEGLAGKYLAGSLEEAVRRLNLCMCYFYDAQYETAMELYNGSREIFGQYRDDEIYGGNIAAVEIFAEIINGRYKHAGQLLEMARKSWTDTRPQKVFQELDGFMAERKMSDSAGYVKCMDETEF